MGRVVSPVLTAADLLDGDGRHCERKSVSDEERVKRRGLRVMKRKGKVKECAGDNHGSETDY